MKMTLEQHKKLGEQCKEFREVLMQNHVMYVGTKSSKESRATANALKHLDHMRNELDRVMCSDYPSANRNIYFSKSKRWIK